MNSTESTTQNTSDPATSAGIIALIVAAGSSSRMNSTVAKPYLEFQGKTLLLHTVERFLAHPMIDAVRVVIRREDHALYKKALFGLTIFPPVIGGATRQDSVRLGLESVAHAKPTNIFVHDAARPLVSDALITRVVEGLREHKAIIPALPATDTIKRVSGGVVTETLPREELYTVQTPQGFDYTTLYDAHVKLRGESLTDDAALMEKLGIPVATVEGDPLNFKVTTNYDMGRFMETVDARYETRTGMGYDVHALAEHESDTPNTQQYIKLCGIKIPHTHYLQGHSDADVGMHAMVDAILGALADGDIGTHFPPDDYKWKGADSERFLMHAYELVKKRGGDIVHMDVTLICEEPKISPHREAMRTHLAQMIKLAPDRISIKATTTERLGFTGRGEGIAAQAIATVRLPR